MPAPLTSIAARLKDNIEYTASALRAPLRAHWPLLTAMLLSQNKGQTTCPESLAHGTQPDSSAKVHVTPDYASPGHGATNPSEPLGKQKPSFFLGPLESGEWDCPPTAHI